MNDIVKFRAIIPKPLKKGIWRLKALNALEKAAKPALKDIQSYVEPWKNRPTFTLRFKTAQNKWNGVKIEIGGSDKAINIFNLLEAGSPPHQISVSSAKTLYFQSGGYSSSTQPGSFRSGFITRGGPWVRPKVVDHPGFEPREIIDTLVEKHEANFTKQAEKAMAEFARESGYGV